MPGGKLIEILTGGLGTKVLDKVGTIVDDSIYSKEERAADEIKAQLQAEEFELKRQELENSLIEKELDLYGIQMEQEVENTKSAREREIEVINATNSSWLLRNITPILAVLIVASTFAMWGMVLFRNYNPKTNEAMIIGSLTTIAMTVISYYFGGIVTSFKKT